ncbi:terminase small subunit [Flavobacterium phage vB_FspM_lotta8-1]|uniref:Terminase small subunit n=1 Tax=Flavobacterium phage vB_FspM_lotta8-1 TaxID=2686242 RepID=A0A6B9LF37_9CAUD|nr:terminase small subunit [Flavobacterium phage vB_FspM_lotta8-1]QHB38481.1 terminase small subunit [Flavobacterium phage vB_FspM_lotta8-1]
MKDNNEKKLPAIKKTEAEKNKDFIQAVFDRNPVGRPRMFSQKEDLEEQIKEYFTNCYEDKIKLTITGLVLFCGFSDRKSFYEYEKNPEFSHTIKKARTLIEMNYELKLQEAFPQGATFALKNLGWTAEEQTETTIKTKTSFYIGGDDDDDEKDPIYTAYEDTE